MTHLQKSLSNHCMVTMPQIKVAIFLIIYIVGDFGCSEEAVIVATMSQIQYLY